MKLYSVKNLALLAGVSVRTLHLYDRIGLLKPSVRTDARYRMYGEQELLRLQQILFYKELDFSLQDIGQILNDPDFDILLALESHKSALTMRRDRIVRLLDTVDKTIVKLKKSQMLNHMELYAGLPKEKVEAYRKEAAAKWGEKSVERSEKALQKLTKPEIDALRADSEAIIRRLLSLVQEDPVGEQVQDAIAAHYKIIRRFWGTAHLPDQQAEAYAGLGKLYVDDERYVTALNGKPYPEFALFMSKAMSYFADAKLK